MSYISSKLKSVGIYRPSTPLSVIAQAMQIGSGAAIETALNMSLLGIGWAIKFQRADFVPRQQYIKEQKQLFREFLNLPEVKAAKFKLLQIKHEGA